MAVENKQIDCKRCNAKGKIYSANNPIWGIQCNACSGTGKIMRMVSDGKSGGLIEVIALIALLIFLVNLFS